MNSCYPQPTVVGDDLTALLVSVSLSNAQISHSLIGPPPSAETLRHGETTSMVGALVLLQDFPELRRYVYDKKYGIVQAGRYRAVLDFSHRSLTPFKSVVLRTGGFPFPFPLQVDRFSLDQALFEKATLSPYCTYHNAGVESIIYDSNTDAIRELVLDDGSRVATSHVFDGSGRQCAIAKNIGLSRDRLDDPHRVVQAYYSARESAEANGGGVRADQGWRDELNILRLYLERDGINGVAVCIPLGNQVAVRVSGSLPELERAGNPADDVLLDMANVALERHGIRRSEHFPEQTRQQSEVNEQYVYERAYGSNWLLLGMAYCNTLVTAAISADTSLEAFHAGAGFIEQPAEIGSLFQQYSSYFLEMQHTWSWLATHDPSALTPSSVRAFTDRYLRANNSQFLHSLRLQYHNSSLDSGIRTAMAVMNHPLLPQLPFFFRSIEKGEAYAGEMLPVTSLDQE